MSFKEHHIEYVDKLTKAADGHGKSITEKAGQLIENIFVRSNGNLDALPIMLKQYTQAVTKTMVTEGRKAVAVARGIGSEFARAKAKTEESGV